MLIPHTSGAQDEISPVRFPGDLECRLCCSVVKGVMVELFDEYQSFVIDIVSGSFLPPQVWRDLEELSVIVAG